MSSTQKTNGFFNVLKNIFFILIAIQLIPYFFGGLWRSLWDAIEPKVHVGCLIIKEQIDDSAFYVGQIQKFLKSTDIKALLIKVDSPGGLPGASQAIFNELLHFKKAKPIVVLVEDMCASGAYYLSAAASRIVVCPSATIGSIGVMSRLPNVKEALDQWKVRFNFVKSGRYKLVGNPLASEDPDDIDYLQQISDNVYRRFVKDVAQERHLLTEDEKIWADGNIFTGEQALERGLVDVLGSDTEARAELKALLKTEEEIKLIYPSRPPQFMRLLGAEESHETATEERGIAGFVTKVLANAVSLGVKRALSCEKGHFLE